MRKIVNIFLDQEMMCYKKDSTMIYNQTEGNCK